MIRIDRYIRLIMQMNWLVTIAIVILMVIGVFFIYSACYSSEEPAIRLLYMKQVTWIIVGFICYTVFAVYDYRKMGRLSWWVYGGVLFLLILVLFTGTKVYGARRWLDFFGIRFQPSELAKLVTLIVLARIMSRPGLRLWEFKNIVFILTVVAVPVLLVIAEPDLGTAMIFVPVAFIMMFVAGVPLRILMSFVGFGLVMLTIILFAMFLPAKLGFSEENQEKIMHFTGLKAHQRDRIMTFFQPDKDPLGAGWNKTQSEMAVGSGGVLGKGFKQGTQNILGFLPKSVAHTDFIYSVIAEEMGFLGSVSILFLFGIIIVAGMQIAVIARDRMGRLLAVAMISMIFCHVFINIAMTVGLMPITGVPLPLLSYGGTFMVVTMSAMGIVQSVYIRCRPVESDFTE
ncbi:MAG: rod shape-determining protein RodA [Kiritimatiellae bacterium]|nr:rod shape-determining protein RodA [Kiritimatiellia bacterium]MDD5521334.1 rod shape-determining protein RodA [Kiritimatiellia bacterium]